MPLEAILLFSKQSFREIGKLLRDEGDHPTEVKLCNVKRED
jgi:hypothetical protein